MNSQMLPVVLKWSKLDGKLYVDKTVSFFVFIAHFLVYRSICTKWTDMFVNYGRVNDLRGSVLP